MLFAACAVAVQLDRDHIRALRSHDAKPEQIPEPGLVEAVESCSAMDVGAVQGNPRGSPDRQLVRTSQRGLPLLRDLGAGYGPTAWEQDFSVVGRSRCRWRHIRLPS